MIQLRKQDIDWIKKAVELELTRLQIKRKLQEAEYTDERIEAFLDQYDIEMDKIRLKEEGRDIKDEEEFKTNVKKYFEDKETLSRSEKREVKKFISQIEKYSKMVKTAIKGFTQEIEIMEKKGINEEKIKKEMEYLKKEIIDRLIESKEILDIEHPKTGREINKENLQDLNVTELIELMEENVEALELIVEGKITE